MIDYFMHNRKEKTGGGNFSNPVPRRNAKLISIVGNVSVRFISLAILLVAMGITSVSARNLDLDSEGWSVLRPSLDSRIMYISESGNDDSGQVYYSSSKEIGGDPFKPSGTIRAFASYSEALNHAREGYPDWILFRRGDEFHATVVPLSGRSRWEPSVVGAYGTSGDLPVIVPPNPESNVISASARRADLEFIVIQSLDFYSVTRDPDSFRFSGPAGTSGIRLYAGGASIRQFTIEGCKFRFFDGNEIQNLGTGVIEDFVIRRSQISDNYSDGSGHCQGLYAFKLNGLFLEENLFAHNGWYSQAPGTLGTATYFNHNIYFEDCHNITFVRNISIKPASMHYKFTANTGTASSTDITIYNNLFVDGELGIGIGGNEVTPVKFVNLNISHNVFTEIGYSRPTNRTLAWGICIQDWDNGVADSNFFLHNSNPQVDNSYAISLEGSSRDVVISNNIVYNINGMFLLKNNRYFTSSFPNQGISIANNIYNDVSNDDPVIQARDFSGLVFRGNSYYNQARNDYKFRIYEDYTSFEDWRAQTGDSSEIFRTSFPDASRSIETFLASIGESGSIDRLSELCREQSILDWNDTLVADNINRWLKAGFTRDDDVIDPGDEVPPPGEILPPVPMPRTMGVR